MFLLSLEPNGIINQRYAQRAHYVPNQNVAESRSEIKKSKRSASKCCKYPFMLPALVYCSWRTGLSEDEITLSFGWHICSGRQELFRFSLDESLITLIEHSYAKEILH